jgi:AraC family L-rhamnose operon regulatory protein RhaS
MARRLFPQWGSGSTPRLSPHRNAGLEIVYVSRGRLRWQIEGHPYDVAAGSVFYTFPWETHGSRDELEPGHRWDYVIFSLSGSRNRPMLPSAFGFTAQEGGRLLERLRRSPRRSLEAGERLPWLVSQLQGELAAPKGDIDIAAALARATLLELDRAVRHVVGRRVPPAPDSCAQLLRRLETEFAEPWTLATLAEAAGLGRTRLAELIQQRTGDSPLVYLNRVRVARAREALRTTSRTVTDIAFGCGFESSQYFARVFRKFTGQTPLACRREKERGGTTASRHQSAGRTIP